MSDTRIEDLRFYELLPFYVNGTLSGDDLQFMQTYLETNPGAGHHLESEQMLANMFKQVVAAQEFPDVLPDLLKQINKPKMKR